MDAVCRRCDFKQVGNDVCCQYVVCLTTVCCVVKSLWGDDGRVGVLFGQECEASSKLCQPWVLALFPVVELATVGRWDRGVFGLGQPDGPSGLCQEARER